MLSGQCGLRTSDMISHAGGRAWANGKQYFFPCVGAYRSEVYGWPMAKF